MWGIDYRGRIINQLHDDISLRNDLSFQSNLCNPLEELIWIPSPFELLLWLLKPLSINLAKSELGDDLVTWSRSALIIPSFWDYLHPSRDGAPLC